MWAGNHGNGLGLLDMWSEAERERERENRDVIKNSYLIKNKVRD